jgi:hypothetical protein
MGDEFRVGGSKAMTPAQTEAAYAATELASLPLGSSRVVRASETTPTRIDGACSLRRAEVCGRHSRQLAGSCWV